ncbi:MAG: beta strand repeat-containing protein [Nitrosotalea sp.]
MEGCPVSSDDTFANCTLAVPEVTNTGSAEIASGRHTITAEGFPSGIKSDQVDFYVSGSVPLSIVPSQGIPGSAITVSAYALAQDDTSVTISFNGKDVQSSCAPQPSGSHSFSCTITIQSQIQPGTYVIKATGDNTGDSDSGSFLAIGGILANPVTEVPGSSVAITGSGFSAHDTTATILFDGTDVTPSSGCPVSSSLLSCTIVVPSTVGGPHIINATGNTGDRFSTPFVVQAETYIDPPDGEVGSSVAVVGSGFSPSDTTGTILFDGTDVTPSSGCNMSDGLAACNFIVPSVLQGSYTVKITGNTGDSFSETFTVIPSLSLSPTSISYSSFMPGSSMSVTGSVFSHSDTSVSLAFNGHPATPSSCPVSSGSFNCSIIIPTPLFAGTYTVNATGNNAGDHTSAVFIENPAITVNPTTAKIQTQITITGTGFSESDYSVSANLDGNDVGLRTLGNPFGCNTDQGNFTCLFLVPYAMSPGTYTLNVVGQTGDTISTKFSIIGLSLNPVFGPKGSTIAVTGGGFASSDNSITLAFNKTNVTPQSGCPVSGGNFACVFTVPDVPGGGYNVTATGNTGDSFTVQFSLLDVELSKSAGPVASTVNFNGSGFEPASQVSVSFNGAPTGFSCYTHYVLNGGSFVLGSGSFPYCQTFIPLGGPNSVFSLSDELGDRVSEPFQITNVNTFDSQLTTFSGGSVSTSSSITGISVAITGSNATDGTQVHIETASMTGPYLGVSSLNQGTNYYGVGFQENTQVGYGIPRSGTARTCITTQSSTAGLTMQYDFVDIETASSFWKDVSNISTNGNTICGDIPIDSSGVFFSNFGEPIAVGPADTTPPVIAPISDQTVEAASSAGEAATYTATATDNIDGTDAVTCSPASGSTFPLGSTTVTCNSQDAAGNDAIPVTFAVTVQDTTPPVLTLPSDITQEATGPSGNAVTYSTSANDLVGGPVTPQCSPASGSTFQVGTTLVTCTATDAHTNLASETFHVIIQDTTPPMITVTDINAKATGTLTPVTFSPTATDIVDGTDPVTCNPISGSTFQLGASTVNCSSTDAHHNIATASFTVTVAETTAPSITLPADIVQEATGPAGNTVTFTATATDIVDGTDPVTCTTVSGSTFPLGSTTVTCTSSNNAGNTATGTFHVIIQDTTPPTLTIQSPTNNAIVNTATVPVSGISSDNVQVSSVTWKVDSGTVSTASGTTNWSFTTNTLSTGLHTVYVNATDEAGNVAKSSVSATYVEPTVTLPPPSGGTTPITFSSSTGGFTSLNSIMQSSLSPSPPPGNYPLGFFSWDMTGFAPSSSVTITITSPVPLHPQSHYFILVGGNWVSIPVSVSGNTMTMTISDNGPFDGNPAVGVISDLGTVANPTDGRVTGGGTIGKNIDFTFEARSDTDKTDNTHGTLEFHDKSGGITLHSDRVSFLSVDNTISQATFSGTGDLGKGHNYIFIASISDPDKTGDHDTFSITVTDNTGKVVYANSGTVKGHIEIHKFAGKDDKSDSGSKHGNNGNDNDHNHGSNKDHNDKNSK